MIDTRNSKPALNHTMQDGNLALNTPNGINLVPTTATIDTAMRLYDMGLNVFPITFGKKLAEAEVTPGSPIPYHFRGKRKEAKQKHSSGIVRYAWKQHQHTRLSGKPSDMAFVFRGRCNIAVVTGETSGNLFVIDCETETTYALHKQAVLARGLPLYAVQSGSTRGGGHIYFRSAAGPVQNIATGTLPDTEIKGHSGYVVGEGSKHPDGGWYRRDPDSTTKEVPTIMVSAIDWLHNKDAQPVQLTLKKHSRKTSDEVLPGVKHSTRAFFTGGELIRGKARNDSLYDAACDMAGCGYSESETLQWALAAPVPQDASYTTAQIRATVKSAHSKPRNPARAFYGGGSAPAPGAPVVEKTANLARAFALHPASGELWQGRAGTTNRKVWDALVHRCTVDGAPGKNPQKVFFRASAREVAEIARCRKNTVTAAIKRMEQAGVIARVGNKYDGRLTFCETALATMMGENSESAVSGTVGYLTDGTYTVPVTAFTETTITTTDAAEDRAVGHIGLTLHRALLQSLTPLTARALATLVGLSAGKVRYALRTDGPLRAHGLVVKTAGGFVAVPHTDEQLQAIAAKCVDHQGQPVAGAGERRKAQHAIERAMDATENIIKWRTCYDKVNYSYYDPVYELPTIAPLNGVSETIDTSTGEIIATPPAQPVQPAVGDAPPTRDVLSMLWTVGEVSPTPDDGEKSTQTHTGGSVGDGAQLVPIDTHQGKPCAAGQRAYQQST